MTNSQAVLSKFFKNFFLSLFFIEITLVLFFDYIYTKYPMDYFVLFSVSFIASFFFTFLAEYQAAGKQ